MNSGGGRGAAWAWGALALVAVVVAAVFGVRVLPGLKVGDVDPIGAVVGLVSLAVGLWSLNLAARALRTPEPTLQEATQQLAHAVEKSETKARRQLLGAHDKPIDVAFAFRAALAHPAAGAGPRSRLGKVVDYYRRLSPRRLVITGVPGAGKTVLAVELILGLIENRDGDDPVPVRISAASLDTGLQTTQAVEEWLLRYLRQVYQIKEATARALVDAGMVTPVIDGLDEMDIDERPGYASRAGQVLRAVNAYQHNRVKGAVVLTCRTAQYEALQELRVWAQDAARVEISPVDGRRARAFLTRRVTDPGRWEPVLAAIKRAPRGPLAQGLATPWRLTLAAIVYDQRDPAGAFVRDPAALAELAEADQATPEALRDHLLGLLIPAAVALSPPPGTADADRVYRWLAVLAGYLNANTATGRTLGGRALSGTDLVLHELWPLAGNRPRLLTAALAAAIWLIGGAAMLAQVPIGFSPRQLVGAGSVIVMALVTVWFGWRIVWLEPSRADPRPLRTRAGRRNVAFWLAVGLALALAGGLAFGLALGLAGGLALGLETSGTADVTDPRDVVRTNLTFGLAFGLAVGLAVGLAFGLAGGLPLGLAIGLAVGLALGLAGLRYVALLACTRRWNAIWLPWRLGRFLHWAYGAGLIRIAGMAYQFRHRELQDYLARHPVSPPLPQTT